MNSSTEPFQTYLDIAAEAALAAGKILTHYQSQLQHIRTKTDHPSDLVSEADHAADRAILDILQRYLPDHSILSEESVSPPRSATHLWAIDPLDGTTNYIHQTPTFATSIALLIRGVPQVGAIYIPAQKELFLAAPDLGATLNHQPIHVSSTATLDQSYLGTYIGYDDRPEQRLAIVSRLMAETQGVRQRGSAAVDLAYIACGRSDAYWQWQGLAVWDMAAGIALVREAGGNVTACDGTPHQTLHAPEILATNGILHSQLEKQLNQPPH